MSFKSASDFNWNLSTKSEKLWVSYQPWLKQGFQHGFGSANLDLAMLSESFPQAEQVLQLKQTHGCNIFDARSAAGLAELYQLNVCTTPPEAPPDADAVIVSSLGQQKINLVTIKTADCVPLLIRAGNIFALVHAGWRGLANRIISSTLVKLAAGQDQVIEVLIGPCAGSSNYEVGKEVIEQIGSNAQFKVKAADKYFLDLAATATNEILASVPTALVHSCAFCTISDKHFFSHRRQGQQAGRNCTFLLF